MSGVTAAETGGDGRGRLTGKVLAEGEVAQKNNKDESLENTSRTEHDKTKRAQIGAWWRQG